MRLPRFRLLVVGFAALLGCAAAWSTTVPETIAPGAPIEAVWRIQQFDFYYRAARGRYQSCSSLHNKISGIMEAMGADRVSVEIACSRDALVDSVVARVSTKMPMQATPQNVQAATTFDTQAQMVARLREIPLPTTATIERFPAEWREVAITTIDGVRLGPEDCDLLEDLHRQIIPHLSSVRVVRKRFSCGDSYLRAARPILIVEALVRREA
jgi:hypothetical protein